MESDVSKDFSRASLSDKRLGFIVESHYKLATTPPTRYARCLGNLFLLLRLKDDASLFSTLPKFHKHIVALVDEWWNRHNDPLLALAKRRIFAIALWDAPQKLRQNILSFLLSVIDIEEDRRVVIDVHTGITKAEAKFIREISDISTRNSLSVSPYHDSMFMSILLDLDGSESDNYSPEMRSTRYGWRFQVAALMRLALDCLDNSLLAYEIVCKSSNLLDQKRVPLQPGSIPEVLEPCSWIIPSPERSPDAAELCDFPVYLWDIESESTIETASIPVTEVNYTVISHTWGRWRICDEGAILKGTPLWRIPKNSRFDVYDLPVLLKAAGLSQRYVWIDLLCIPQDTMDEHLAKVCQSEIARQATIFQHATIAVAWINDVESWKVTESAIKWMALQWLKTGVEKISELGDIDKLQASSVGPASAPCELLMNTSNGRQNRILPGWFSSLWTLQETIMCPGMFLLNKHWQPLRTGDITPITISSLAALVNTYESSSNNDTQPPQGFRELQKCLRISGLANISQSKRLSAVTLGRCRDCTGSRAEAIMSVTDATDWYVGRKFNQFSTSRDVEPLVLGLYPLPFIEEVRSKIGAAFFMCTHDVSTNAARSATSLSSRGTMLPFMTDLDTENLFGTSVWASSGGVRSDHPSLRTWKIQMDGSVELGEVAIVGSNLVSRKRSMVFEKRVVRIEANEPGNTHTRAVIQSFTNDFESWINKFEGEAYAICLNLDDIQLSGVILHQFNAKDRSFVKAGCFQVMEPIEPIPFRIPLQEKVNWKVL